MDSVISLLSGDGEFPNQLSEELKRLIFCMAKIKKGFDPSETFIS